MLIGKLSPGQKALLRAQMATLLETAVKAAVSGAVQGARDES